MSDRVVVLGAGSGGVVAANLLRRGLPRDAEVVLVDSLDHQLFAPSFLWVLSGSRRPEQCRIPLAPLARKGIRFVQGEVGGIDVDDGRVRLGDSSVDFDYLVISLGARLAPEALPGFSEAAHNIYTLEGVTEAARALRSADGGGRLVVLVSSMPYKCPAAPYEAAMLADDVLRRAGVRDRWQIEIVTPEPLPLPTAGAALGEAVKGLVEAKGIKFSPKRKAVSIDPGSQTIGLEEGGDVTYDLLFGVPPHTAAGPAREAGITGETGWVMVDAQTLELAGQGSGRAYAIGDITSIPLPNGLFLPKAGVFAHGQAEVVARRIVAQAAGQEPVSRFDGHGMCYLELGGGRAGFAKGDFYHTPDPDVRMGRPGRYHHLGKVLFEKWWRWRWF